MVVTWDQRGTGASYGSFEPASTLPLPRHLLIIPLIWAVLASPAAVGHGVLEDVGLIVFGALAAGVCSSATAAATTAPATRLDVGLVLTPVGQSRGDPEPLWRSCCKRPS